MNWLDALGWTIVHSLWEGAAIALLLALALCVARSASVRYLLSCGALAAVAIAFSVTLAYLMPRPLVVILTPLSAFRNAPLSSIGSPFRNAIPVNAGITRLVAMLWMIGVAVLQCRTIAGWLMTIHYRRAAVVNHEWQQRLADLGTKLGITRVVRLLESSLADAPLLIGHLRPVILIPAGLLTGLPASQIESILAHELAHVRRWDFLVNLVQSVVDGLFFYHPAAWWISRVIRSERENCCDDLAVAIHGDRREYASALAALEEHRWTMAGISLAASGGNLTSRIHRLLRSGAPMRPLVPVTLILLSFGLVLGAFQTALPRPWRIQAPAFQLARNLQSTPWQRWVDEDVVYIIRAGERAEFESLKTGAERDHFIEQFWLRRDPTPGTPGNEYKEEHYRRIAFVRRYDVLGAQGKGGWKTDRGRIYIIYGPPDEIDSHPSGDPRTKAWPYEQWRYRFMEGIGANVLIEFEDPRITGEFRMTSDPRGR